MFYCLFVHFYFRLRPFFLAGGKVNTFVEVVWVMMSCSKGIEYFWLGINFWQMCAEPLSWVHYRDIENYQRSWIRVNAIFLALPSYCHHIPLTKDILIEAMSIVKKFLNYLAFLIRGNIPKTKDNDPKPLNNQEHLLNSRTTIFLDNHSLNMAKQVSKHIQRK